MMAVDDIIVFPFKSLSDGLSRDLQRGRPGDGTGRRSIRLELGQPYLSLEAGGIDEATFDERERELLDRLDELEAQHAETERGRGNTSAPEDEKRQSRRRRSPMCISSLGTGT